MNQEMVRNFVATPALGGSLLATISAPSLKRHQDFQKSCDELPVSDHPIVALFQEIQTMANRPLANLATYLRRIVAASKDISSTDRDLLEAFAFRNDEAAFAAGRPNH